LTAVARTQPYYTKYTEIVGIVTLANFLTNSISDGALKVYTVYTVFTSEMNVMAKLIGKYTGKIVTVLVRPQFHGDEKSNCDILPTI
jgi:hypothetical protein